MLLGGVGPFRSPHWWVPRARRQWLHVWTCLPPGASTMCSTCHCSSTTTRMGAHDQHHHPCTMTRRGRLSGWFRTCWMNARIQPQKRPSSRSDGKAMVLTRTPGPGHQISWTSPSSLSFGHACTSTGAEPHAAGTSASGEGGSVGSLGILAHCTAHAPGTHTQHMHCTAHAPGTHTQHMH